MMEIDNSEGHASSTARAAVNDAPPVGALMSAAAAHSGIARPLPSATTNATDTASDAVMLTNSTHSTEQASFDEGGDLELTLYRFRLPSRYRSHAAKAETSEECAERASVKGTTVRRVVTSKQGVSEALLRLRSPPIARAASDDAVTRKTASDVRVDPLELSCVANHVTVKSYIEETKDVALQAVEAGPDRVLIISEKQVYCCPHCSALYAQQQFFKSHLCTHSVTAQHALQDNRGASRALRNAVATVPSIGADESYGTYFRCTLCDHDVVLFERADDLRRHQHYEHPLSHPVSSFPSAPQHHKTVRAPLHRAWNGEREDFEASESDADDSNDNENEDGGQLGLQGPVQCTHCTAVFSNYNRAYYTHLRSHLNTLKRNALTRDGLSTAGMPPPPADARVTRSKRSTTASDVLFSPTEASVDGSAAIADTKHEWTCTHCYERFSMRSKYYEHRRTCKQKLAADALLINGATSPSEDSSGEDVEKSSKSPFVCNVCGEELAAFFSLRRHKDVHPKKGYSGPTYLCRHCNAPFCFSQKCNSHAESCPKRPLSSSHGKSHVRRPRSSHRRSTSENGQARHSAPAAESSDAALPLTQLLRVASESAVADQPVLPLTRMQRSVTENTLHALSDAALTSTSSPSPVVLSSVSPVLLTSATDVANGSTNNGTTAAGTLIKDGRVMLNATCPTCTHKWQRVSTYNFHKHCHSCARAPTRISRATTVQRMRNASVPARDGVATAEIMLEQRALRHHTQAPSDADAEEEPAAPDSAEEDAKDEEDEMYASTETSASSASPGTTVLCSVCKLSFVSQITLDSHLKHRANDAVNNHPCDFCSHRFPSHVMLHRHQQRHKEAGHTKTKLQQQQQSPQQPADEAPKICHMCSANLSSLSTLADVDAHFQQCWQKLVRTPINSRTEAQKLAIEAERQRRSGKPADSHSDASANRLSRKRRRSTVLACVHFKDDTPATAPQATSLPAVTGEGRNVRQKLADGSVSAVIGQNAQQLAASSPSIAATATSPVVAETTSPAGVLSVSNDVSALPVDAIATPALLPQPSHFQSQLPYYVAIHNSMSPLRFTNSIHGLTPSRVTPQSSHAPSPFQSLPTSGGAAFSAAPPALTLPPAAVPHWSPAHTLAHPPYAPMVLKGHSTAQSAMSFNQARRSPAVSSAAQSDVITAAVAPAPAASSSSARVSPRSAATQRDRMLAPSAILHACTMTDVDTHSPQKSSSTARHGEMNNQQLSAQSELPRTR